jgi:ribonucleoside-triphosphate reductase
VKRFIYRVFTTYKIPYISITPTFSICPVHGYIPGYHKYCPYPHTEEELIRAGLLHKKAHDMLTSFSMR